MKYAPLVKRIAGEGARAWEIHYAAQRRRDTGEDVIVLSVGDPDFSTPAAIVDAAIDSLRRGRHHYTPSVGIPELRDAVARNHQRITGQSASADNVAILAGAQSALMAVALCVLGDGDEVIVPEPMYVTYEGVAGVCGARLVSVALRPEDGFQVDPGRIEAAIGPNSRALLINTPHNPTGAVLGHAVLEELAAICRRHDLWMISDEVYADITYDTPHISPCSFPAMAERSAIISSLSKSHAMTGWRLGWVVGPTQLIEHIDTLSSSTLYGSPPFIQDAAVVALNKNHSELAHMKAAYRARRDRLCADLQAIEGVSVRQPEGGLFVMADIRPLGMTSQEFVQALYESENVSVLSGEAFGPSGVGHVRISLASSETDLIEGCQRMARFVAGLKERQGF
ncbi:MAG: aminotransferase class I/II-fold pyridoxal phosphate-dependent enzyme [Rhodospirillaceae bacterium]|nr:aminotransferase class I/II-fold pyridoxal phosphate-dependent enzyme [Rhodospirillaceae bacterium]